MKPSGVDNRVPRHFLPPALRFGDQPSCACTHVRDRRRLQADWGELVQAHDDRDAFEASDRRAARDENEPASESGCSRLFATVAGRTDALPALRP